MVFKVALVGIGKIARDQHIPAIGQNPEFELCAAVSRHSSVEGVDTFTDLEAMLAARPDVDLVSLCMPPSARFAYAAVAIAAGRDVMMEKPPGATLSECHELARMAREKGVSLFATWHSRCAAFVPQAKTWLADKKIRSVRVIWKEDVRRWHPGQDWIWQPGGLGVFDTGINAMSILSEIMPMSLFVQQAVLEFPANRATPIAADIVFCDPGGAEVSMALDWRQQGAQTWDIEVLADEGRLVLSSGGAKLAIDDKPVGEAPDREYAGLYKRMAHLMKADQSDVDLSPMVLVADAFTLGQRREVEEFHF